LSAASGATVGAPGRLARLHLGTGLLRLARVELEELAGEGRLDSDGVLDLAEARWRTGDLRGAAEAAGAWLEAGADEVEGGAGRRARALAHAVIADGLTVRGRHDDAAVHVAATLAAFDVGLPGLQGSPEPGLPVAAALDALFAGIVPRADAWPAFEPGGGGPGSAEADSAGEATARVFPPHMGSTYMGAAAPDPIAAADDRLEAGDDAAAAVLLVLALRATPSRAEDVLERADSALATRSSAALLLARAEALRALGRHEAAGIAYAVADAHARGGAPAASPVPGPAAAAAPDPEGSHQ
jgi:hypothetical protein